MSEPRRQEVTRLLQRIREGEPKAVDGLLPLVYSELRAVAGQLFREQRPDHTLQPTALVSEAYLRLCGRQGLEARDRGHFLALASKAMRNLLVDHARRKKAGKRGEGWERVTLDAVVAAAAERSLELLDLDIALGELAGLHERQARVVELRVFGGLTVPEAAEALGVARSTVDADWAMARAWLTRRLRGENAP